MTRRLAVPIVLLVLLAAACGRPSEQASPSQEAPFGVSLRPSPVPVQGESGQAQLTSSSRGVILSWLERKEALATLKFSELSSGMWTGARTIASSDRWFVSDADTPTVMRMSDGTLVAAIYPVVDVRIEAYDLRLTYSRDDGKTWAPLISPHHDKTRTQHGFASLFELPGRSLGIVWLDGRDQELNTSDPLGGSMDVYFASFDSTWKQNAEASINKRVCECCQTATAVSSDGPVVAFRDRSDQEIRDIHVARVEAPSTALGASAKWTEAVPVHADKWQIDACPVNGPALSALGKTVAVAWFTAAGGTGHSYAAFSQDAGRTWDEPIRLDDGSSLGQVDLELLDDGSAVATWLEFASERTQVRTRRVQPSGERSASVILAGADEPRVSGYPHVARSGNELVFAWSETMGGPQQVKAAIGTLK